jgi:hypothetical protein
MKKRAARHVKPREKAEGSAIDEYVAQAPPATRPILQRIRAIVREQAPGAEERISYRMAAFFHGRRPRASRCGRAGGNGWVCTLERGASVAP